MNRRVAPQHQSDSRLNRASHSPVFTRSSDALCPRTERSGVGASVCLISLLLFSAALVHAQSYAIDWFTLDGGSGTSTGGEYSVSGTVGQQDAGVMSGGEYSLVG